MRQNRQPGDDEDQKTDCDAQSNALGKRTSGVSRSHAAEAEANESQDTITEQNESDQVFTCTEPGCNKTFTRQVRLAAHMHLHSGTQPYKCPVSTCTKRFSEKQNLKIHMRIHSDERPFACTANGCNKHFRTKGNMLDHLRRHSGEK